MDATTTEWSWTKTAAGYELLDGAVRLEKQGRNWNLTIDQPAISIDLGRKASFDAANRALDGVMGR